MTPATIWDLKFGVVFLFLVIGFVAILISIQIQEAERKIMKTLADILAAEQEETAALQALKAVVAAVPVAIQALKDKLSQGQPIQPADLDSIVQAMHLAAEEIKADTDTLTAAVAPDLPPPPTPTPVVEPTGTDVPPTPTSDSGLV